QQCDRPRRRHRDPDRVGVPGRRHRAPRRRQRRRVRGRPGRGVGGKRGTSRSARYAGESLADQRPLVDHQQARSGNGGRGDGTSGWQVRAGQEMTSANSMAATPLRVMIVDDHRLLRKGIARLLDLEPGMTVVAEAGNGEEAVEQFRRHTPDVTLMDLELPRLDGIEAITAIRRQFPNARVIALTMYQGDEDIHRAVQAGAVAYLLKDTVPEVLVQVIRDV